jgi:hypothetical protein
MKAPSLSGQAVLLILLCLASACAGSGTSTTRATVQTDSTTPTLSKPTLAIAPTAALAATPTAELATQPSPTAEAPAAHPALDFSENTLDTPSGLSEAATYLAARAHDPTDSAAAAAAILTRAGIPILSPFDGRMVNQPVTPNLADAYVYDFEAPLVGSGIAAHRYWALNDVSAFVSNLGLDLNGQPIPDTLYAEALARWTQTAVDDPTAPGEFLPLVVRELGLHHPAPQDLADKPDAAAIQLDPLQFTLIVASLTSRFGVAQTAFAPRPPGLAFPASGSPCATVSKTFDDPTGISKKYAKDSLLDTLRDDIEKTFGADAADAFKKGADYFDAGEDGLAVGLLLAGIHLDVSDDAKPVKQNAHYAHQVAAAENFYSYIATLRFDSPFPDTTLQCAGLAGIKLPDNGPLQGWQIRWRLEQDKKHVAPATSADSNKLERGFGGGGGGEITGDDGQSKLRVELAREPGCPSESSCKKGIIKTGTATGTACADTTDLPLKLSDLMPGLSGAFKFGKAAGKLIIDMVKRMSLPCVGDTVVITWHHPDTFLLTIDSTAVLSTSAGPVKQHIVWKVTVRFDDDWNVVSGDGQVQTIDLSLPQIPKCSFTPGRGVTMPVQVTGGKFQPRSTSWPVVFAPDDIAITFEPNWSQSAYAVRCPGGGGSGMMAPLMEAWRIAYQPNGSAAHEGYTFTKWLTGPLSGKKAMQDTIHTGKGDVTLSTNLELAPFVGP